MPSGRMPEYVLLAVVVGDGDVLVGTTDALRCLIDAGAAKLKLRPEFR